MNSINIINIINYHYLLLNLVSTGILPVFFPRLTVADLEDVKWFAESVVPEPGNAPNLRNVRRGSFLDSKKY